MTDSEKTTLLKFLKDSVDRCLENYSNYRGWKVHFEAGPGPQVLFRFVVRLTEYRHVEVSSIGTGVEFDQLMRVFGHGGAGAVIRMRTVLGRMEELGGFLDATPGFKP